MVEPPPERPTPSGRNALGWVGAPGHQPVAIPKDANQPDPGECGKLTKESPC